MLLKHSIHSLKTKSVIFFCQIWPHDTEKIHHFQVSGDLHSKDYVFNTSHCDQDLQVSDTPWIFCDRAHYNRQPCAASDEQDSSAPDSRGGWNPENGSVPGQRSIFFTGIVLLYFIHCMSKKSCPVVTVNALYKNWKTSWTYSRHVVMRNDQWLIYIKRATSQFFLIFLKSTVPMDSWFDIINIFVSLNLFVFLKFPIEKFPNIHLSQMYFVSEWILLCFRPQKLKLCSCFLQTLSLFSLLFRTLTSSRRCSLV